jgi:hypothetical protein
MAPIERDLSRIFFSVLTVLTYPDCDASASASLDQLKKMAAPSGDSNLRTRVRGFESFGDLREKEKIRVFSQGLESFGDMFLNFKKKIAAKKSRIKSKFVVFSDFIERFIK